MGRTILLIHGRDFKPPRAALRELWIDALRHGLRRDHAPAKLRAFDRTRIEFVYYGSFSNRFLSQLRGVPPPDDVASRRATLRDLKRFAADEFSRRNYNRLPGRTSIKEALADVFGPALSRLRLSEAMIEQLAPDMRHYWNFDSQFGSDVRATLSRPLRLAMDRGDRIAVLSHSLGTLVAYDTFWKFSHTAEYRPRYSRKKISLWVTMGSPLGDETVKRNLKGARASKQRRYPSNISRWVNIAAHDDFISHDQKIRNDYKNMNRWNLLRYPLEDHRIYNLSVRHGESNPHSAAGYLTHPLLSGLIADWL